MAISFDDFKKVNLRVAKVLRAEVVEGSEKLVKLTLDLGDAGPPCPTPALPNQGEQVEASPPSRQIVAGIGKQYTPEALIGKYIVIVENLEPRKLMGLESQGMLLAASDEDGPVLLVPEREVPPGSEVR